jgi:membrane protease YdiL (CAAX protease family)
VKECPSCGSQSAEAASACEGCGAAFPANETHVPAEPPSAGRPDPSVGPDSLRSERRLQVFELLLVCFIAFGGALFLSAYILFTGTPPSESMHGDFRWWYSISHQVGGLALLWYVLRRRAQNFSDLGLFWKGKELAVTPLLWFACAIVAYIFRLAIQSFGGFPSNADPNEKVAAYMFANGIGIGMIVFQLVNPLFEELIVRAYVMTRVREVTNSLPLAIITSVVLQVSYHFYQGMWMALSYTGVFLVLSLYYAKTNRILAPILTHMIFDLSATLYYTFKLAH